jgi:hypothetical protein
MSSQFIYLSREGQTFGPFLPQQIDEMRRNGELLKYMWIYDGTAPEWKPIAPPPPAPMAPSAQVSAIAGVSTVSPQRLNTDPSGAPDTATRNTFDILGSGTITQFDPMIDEDPEDIALENEAALEGGAGAEATPPGTEEVEPTTSRPVSQTAPSFPQRPAQQAPAPAQAQAQAAPEPTQTQVQTLEQATNAVAHASELQAVCHDFRSVLSGSLVTGSARMAIFVSPTRIAGLAPFRSGSRVFMNLLHGPTGRAENVAARVRECRLDGDGCWRIALDWEQSPRLLAGL